MRVGAQLHAGDGQGERTLGRLDLLGRVGSVHARLVERERDLHRRTAQLADRGVLLEGDHVAAALNLGHREDATADDHDGDEEEYADADVCGDNQNPPILLAPSGADLSQCGPTAQR